MANCEQLEIDTKDMCLLCLGAQNANSSINFSQNTISPSLQGLKHLLRYLKVSPKELFNCSSEFLQSMKIREDINLKINLCSGCSSVTEKFHKLYQEYELIQLQFGNCVQTLHESISKGNENTERVRKYMDQMKPTKSADLVNASIAANLRNETLKKCTLKLQSGVPRVSLSKPRLERNLPESPKNDDTLNQAPIPIPKSNLRRSIPLSHDRKKSKSVTWKPLLVSYGGDKPNSSKTTKSKVPRSSSKGQKRETRSKTSQLVILDTDETTKDPPPKVDSTNRFNAIKKKIKNKTKRTATTALRRGRLLSCQYCKASFKETKYLQTHKFTQHAEHIIRIYVSPNISLTSCKIGVDAVWEQMCKKHGLNCEFCSLKMSDRKYAKRHVICCHTEHFAVKVRQYLDLDSVPKPVKPVVASTSKINMDKRKINLKSPIPFKKTKEAVKKTPPIQGSHECEYCEWVSQTSEGINLHETVIHTEQFICKFLPDISLEACKERTAAVWKQTRDSSRTEAGFKCEFCDFKLVKKSGYFKRHLITCHPELIATKVLHYLPLKNKVTTPPPPKDSVERQASKIVQAAVAAILKKAKQRKPVAPKGKQTTSLKFISKAKKLKPLSDNSKIGSSSGPSKPKDPKPTKVNASIKTTPRYNSLKKNLMKTQSKTTHGKTTSAVALRRNRFGVSCEHCTGKYMPGKCLTAHKILKHTEHIVIKLLPSHVSLEACKKGTNDVFQRMCETEKQSEFGYRCEFCKLVIKGSFNNFKRHMICIHERKFATKVYQQLTLVNATGPTTVSGVANDHEKNSSKHLQDPVPGPSSSINVENTARKNSYRCRFCDYVTSFSSTLRYHSLEHHPTDNVMDNVNVPQNVSQVACDSVVNSVLNRVVTKDGVCFKCGNQFTKLRRHVLVHHFEDFLVEVKNGLGYLEVDHNQGESSVRTDNANNEADVLEIELLAEIEFEEEGVKVEAQGRPEPIDGDPLVDFLD